MRNVQDTFETHKRSFSSAFSICMAEPLNKSFFFFFFFFFCDWSHNLSGFVCRTINGVVLVSIVNFEHVIAGWVVRVTFFSFL